MAEKRCKLIWGFLLFAAVFMLGCSAERLPDYPMRPLSEYGQTKSQDGVTIAVHPMTDSQETKKYFGMDLLHNDILAVFIAVENGNSTASYIVQKNRISLNEGTTGKSSKVGDNATANVEGSVIVGAILVFPPAALVTMPFMAKEVSNSAEIKRNFASKELHQETISPDKIKSGFVYFLLPHDRPAQTQKILNIGMWNPIAKSSKTFEYQIEIGRK
jgi:hypothetical protein